MSHVFFLSESQIKTLTLSLSSKFHLPQKNGKHIPLPFSICHVFFVFVLLHADLPVRAIDLGDVLESPKTEELSAGRMLQWLHVGLLFLYLCWGRYHPNIYIQIIRSIEVNSHLTQNEVYIIITCQWGFIQLSTQWVQIPRLCHPPHGKAA